MRNNKVAKSKKITSSALFTVILLPVMAAFSAALSILSRYRKTAVGPFPASTHSLTHGSNEKTMAEAMNRVREIPLEPVKRSLPAAVRSLVNCLPALLETAWQTAGILYPYPVSFVPIVIKSLDGTPVCGVLATQQCEEDRPGLVLAHGFLSSKNSYENVNIALKAYYEWGFNVFAIDLRHSGDTNRISEVPGSWGFKEAEDILAAVKYIGSIEGTGAISVCGTDLGASAAIIAAGNYPNSGITGGIIAISPYSDARRTMKNLSDLRSGTPGQLLARLSLVILIRLKTVAGGIYSVGDFESYTKEMSCQYYEMSEDSLYEKSSPVNVIDRLDKPCLVIHSERDRVVPAGEVEELLFCARRNPMIDSIILPCGGHGKYSAVYPAWFYRAIRTFLSYWTGLDAGPETGTNGGNELGISNNRDN